MDNEGLEILTDKAADLIVSAGKIVVFTGAGISTESGIPDFRSPGGLWYRYDPEDFTYQKFVSSPETRRKQWQMFRERFQAGEVKPNPAHYAVAEMDRLSRLDCVITQNVDGLHREAGVPDDRVLELHGSLQWVICLSCGRRYPFAQIKTRLDTGEEMPDCEVCHGMLKPDVVLFGEALPEEVLKEATFRSYESDLFIVIGSTLIIYPAASMPGYAIDAGAKLVIINLSPTPMDSQASVLIRAKAGETMSAIIKRVKEKIA